MTDETMRRALKEIAETTHEYSTRLRAREALAATQDQTTDHARSNDYVWRCEVTNNPVGTDTRMIGSKPCECRGCRGYAFSNRARSEWEAGREAAVEQVAKIINGAAFRPAHVKGEGLSETEKEKWLRARNVALYKADRIMTALRPSAGSGGAFDPARTPGHTDMMVTPESLDAFMEANPLSRQQRMLRRKKNDRTREPT